MNGHRDLEIKLFSTSPPAKNSDRRSFFADKSESAVNRCTMSGYDRNVNSAVLCDKVESSVEGSGESEGVLTDEHNICDLALVTA